MIIGNRARDYRMEGFDCPHLCGRSYKYKRNLATHLKLECGKKPNFKCPYCDKTSFHKSNLKLHIGNIHNIIVSHL